MMPAFRQTTATCSRPTQVKKAFIRHVYTILVSQILLTTAILYSVRWFYNIDEGGDALRLQPTSSGEAEGPSGGVLSGLFWLGFLGSMASLAVLHAVARQSPHNLAALFAFTVFESLLLTSALVSVPGGLLARALVTTAGVFVGLILYTLKSAKNTDYSFLGSYLGAALWILIVASFMQVFWPMGDLMDTLFTWGGALIFCGFVILDTWRLHFQVRRVLSSLHSLTVPSHTWPLACLRHR